MEFHIPDDFALVQVQDNEYTADLTDLIQAVATSGHWTNKWLDRILIDPEARKLLTASVEGKGGADIKTYLDSTSEEIYAHVLFNLHGYEGGFIGEEGRQINLESKLTVSADGMDGTENAVRRTEGPRSPYATSAGEFEDVNGAAVPRRGAIYLPRQNIGIAGMYTEDKKIAVQFKLGWDIDTWVAMDFEEITPFDQERRDLQYVTGIWRSAQHNPEMPAWAYNLFMKADKAGEQTTHIAHSSAVAGMADVTENMPHGVRLPQIGPSVYVSVKDIKLHDIMGIAPAFLAAGGVIGNMAEHQLAETADFISGVGLGSLGDIKRLGKLPELPVGPLIAAQNSFLFYKALDFMDY